MGKHSDFFEKNKKQTVVYVLSAILIISVMIFSCVIRAPKENENFTNSDATYHVLLTMKAYDENPLSIHKFLPIVSFGDITDKNATWGFSVPDGNGNYFYTSFSPVGFAAPYIFVKIFGLPINEMSLYVFNSLLYCLCALLTMLLLLKLFKNKFNAIFIAAATLLIYFFQIETMHSQGMVYWHQSIFQFLLIIQIFIFLNLKGKLSYILFFLFCIAMPYVEWTGYVSNLGFALAFVIFGKAKSNEIKKIQNANNLKFISATVGATILSFALYAIHFLSVIPKQTFIDALAKRMVNRSIINSKSIIELLIGYKNSFGILLITILILIIIALPIKKIRERLWQTICEFKLAIFIFAFPLLENIVMKEHAIEYCYDRMKMIFIIILFFFILTYAYCVAIKKEATFNIILIAILVLISSANIYIYVFADNMVSDTFSDRRWKAEWLYDNKSIAKFVSSNYNSDNSIIGHEFYTFAYSNLLFQRGVYQDLDLNLLKSITKAYKRRYAIFIKGDTKNWDFHRKSVQYDGITIVDLQNDKVSEYAIKNGIIKEVMK